MSQFTRLLAARQTDPSSRNWVYVPYDQLSSGMGPLSREDPRSLGVVMVENPAKAALRPYHKQKLALVVGNMRRFALEQAERGISIEYLQTNGPYRNALIEASERLGHPLRVMRPAEYELRADLQPAVEDGLLQVIPHEGWLTTKEQWKASHKNAPPWLLERFYRFVRNQTGVLMESGEPQGGRYNFDDENREPYKNGPPSPVPPHYPDDPVKTEVCDLILSSYAGHPGNVDPSSLPTTSADANALWEWAKRSCLPNFGKYEDAMSTGSSGLFHTRISALLNIYRLLPARVVAEAEALPIPIASKEGFIRQILGWREFMHHVHEETDGFRRIPGRSETPVSEGPGDGGYRHWTGRDWPGPDNKAEGSAQLSALGADNSLVPAYWGIPSGLNCLDTVVKDVWKEGWSHHITRLMILSNLATLLDLSPRELTDWFWVAYIDAYDWVVEPNVLGLGTFATGALFTTKPYVSGSNYINRMSDYCKSCRFNPKTTCPFPSLYWAFLERHRDLLETNSRLFTLYRAANRRSQEQKRADHKTYLHVLETLSEKRELEVDH